MNHLARGDIVLAFGDLSLAGASDQAIEAFIDDHASRPEADVKSPSRSGDAAAGKDDDGDGDEDDDDSSDPFGDNGLMPVIIMRSLAVHVAALQARLAVAMNNYSRLMAQGE